MKDSELEALTLELGYESGLFLRESVAKLTDTLAPYPGIIGIGRSGRMIWATKRPGEV